MNIQTFQLEHIPIPHKVHVVTYTDVSNSPFLRDQLLAGNADFEYAFIDSASVISRAHVLAAVHQAVHKLLITNTLRTKNVHSEIVFNLSPNNNITESFRRFGITDITTSLLCIKVATPEKWVSSDEVQRHLGEVVRGTPVEFTDDSLAKQTDWAKVSRYYKIKLGKDRPPGPLEDVEVEVLGKLIMRAIG